MHPAYLADSGFCQKLETFLRFSGIKLGETVHMNGPKGKVPYADIKHDGKTITVPDSYFIIRYLIENGLVEDPDTVAGLTPAQKGESRAWRGYIEEVLPCDRSRSVVYGRKLRSCFIGNILKEVLALAVTDIMRQVMQSIWNTGIGHHSREEAQTL